MFADYMMWSVNASLMAYYGEFFGGYGASTEFCVGQDAEVNAFFHCNILGGYEAYKINHYFYSLDIKQAMTEFVIDMIRKEGEVLNNKYISNHFQENDFYSKFYKVWLNPDSVRRTLETDQGVIFRAKLRKKDKNNVYETSFGGKSKHVTIYRYNFKGKRIKLISKPYYGTGDLIDYVNYCDKLIRIGELRKEA